MTDIALFHSVLGVRPGVLDAAQRLRAAGHRVTVVDQYDGRVFDDYAPAMAFADDLGYPALAAAALAAVADLPADTVYAGFSNGGAMAQWCVLRRPGARAAVLLAGAAELTAFAAFGVEPVWPAGVPVTTHYMRADPYLEPASVEAFLDQARLAGAAVEPWWYEGTGHLFTDPSLPAEHDPAASDLLWHRVLEFLGRVGGPASGRPAQAST